MSVLVSIVVPVFNRAQTVVRTLESIRAQEYRPIEVVVINDGSTDESGESIARWFDKVGDPDLRLRMLCTDNRGAPSARNLGMTLAEGKYLQFLDSDDILGKEKIKEQVCVLERFSAQVAVCDFQIIGFNVGVPRDVRNSGDLLKRLSFGWSVSASTPLIARDLVIGKIEWHNKLKSRQDMDFMFKVFLLCDEYVYTPGLFFSYVQHDGTQISDRYGRDSPQYLDEIWSVARFSIDQVRTLNIRKQTFVVLRVVNLLGRFLRYWGMRAFRGGIRAIQGR